MLRIPAVAAIAKEIRGNRLPRQGALACRDCGKPAQNFDHRDYYQPLAVEPVCRTCNNLRGAAYPFTPGSVAHFVLDEVAHAG